MAEGVGALAGGFLKAFAAARDGKRDKEETDKYKKAMTQLLELQIDQARRTSQARTDVGNMMAPQPVTATPPEFQFPQEGQLGEIQTTKPAGPMIKPGMSFLDVMSDPHGRIAALESGLMEQMQSADEMSARGEFSKGIQESGLSPAEFMNTPQGGALAARVIRNPAEFIRATQGGDSPLDQLMATLQIQTRQDQLTRDRAADERAATEREQAAAAARTTLVRNIDQTRDIADVTKKLEGSFLQAGLPASSLRRTGISVLAGLGAAAGMDTKQLDENLVAFDVAKKNLNDQLINLIAGGGMGQNLSVAELRQYQASLANTDISSGAIMAIQAKIAQGYLDDADAKKISVPNRESIERDIQEWKHYEAPDRKVIVDTPKIAANVAAIGKMGVDELVQLSQNVSALSDEAREAAAKRWDELQAIAAQ